jgi:hypothetical protein
MTRNQRRAERQQIEAAIRQAAQPLLKPGTMTTSDWKAVMVQLSECHERLLALPTR